MRQMIDDQGMSQNPRRQLVGSMSVEKMLIVTPLLKRYLDHGMHVMQVHQAIEYVLGCFFLPFMEALTEFWHLGDHQPQAAILEETYKLIMAKVRHKSVRYVEGNVPAGRKVNGAVFRSMTQLDDEGYEVEMGEIFIHLDLPIVLGYAILQ